MQLIVKILSPLPGPAWKENRQPDPKLSAAEMTSFSQSCTALSHNQFTRSWPSTQTGVISPAFAFGGKSPYPGDTRSTQVLCKVNSTKTVVAILSTRSHDEHSQNGKRCPVQYPCSHVWRSKHMPSTRTPRVEHGNDGPRFTSH